MSTPAELVQGLVSPGFEPVAETFRENLTKRGGVGASLCVYRRGEKVVDIWGGKADKKTGAPWEKDSVCVMFSATKGLAAIALMMLADRGQLDYDAPVAKYWPEFGAAGKEAITVRTLLNHRAGLHGQDTPIPYADIVARRDVPVIAAQEPLWPPDEGQGYHGVTFGLYARELFFRASGQRMGTFFADEVAKPLGIDAYIGAPLSIEPRFATLYPQSTYTKLTKVVPRLLTGGTHEGKVYRAAARKRTDTSRAFKTPSDMGITSVGRYGTPEIWTEELPWGGGVANGRALALAYAALLGVGPEGTPALVRPETLAPVFERQSWAEPDRVVLKPMGFAQGFVKEETRMFSPNTEAFGHPGAGGSLGWADPVEGLAIGYVMNQMDFRIRSARSLALTKAIYGCL
ncbi:MAG: CubicO group peptidase (beta-lactamase class C family) [Myxococcota bacterium]|jgi:CubicO group peptidase (beta-lactamase class C family)